MQQLSAASQIILLQKQSSDRQCQRRTNSITEYVSQPICDFAKGGQEQACTRITRLFVRLFGWLFSCPIHRKWLLTVPQRSHLQVKPVSRLDQTRIEEYLVQQVFCTVDTGSCFGIPQLSYGKSILKLSSLSIVLASNLRQPSVVGVRSASRNCTGAFLQRGININHKHVSFLSQLLYSR